ncbi:MAG: hypothetical protein ACRDFS_09185, partial [Chloroflexota bacterium]
GKQSFYLDRSDFLELATPYRGAHLDLGTGDGRYVLSTARAHPNQFVIGVDACRENLQRSSRCAPNNALFVIANALALPPELGGIASQISIVFPWGSLLAGILDVDKPVLEGVAASSRRGASLEIVLNAGALSEQGWELHLGVDRARERLRGGGFVVDSPRLLDAASLRRIPSTWAKRLAFGRDPRAVAILARGGKGGVLGAEARE